MKPTRSNPLFARFFRAGITSLIVVSGAAFAADSISLNFGADETNGSLDTAPAALPAGAINLSGAVWNNMTGASGTDVAVTANAGAGGTVSWTSGGTYRSASTGATATSQNGVLTKGSDILTYP